MKRIIFILLPAALVSIGIVSCKKETAVDDFISFGRLKITNATIYNTLHAQLAGNTKQLSTSDYIKLVPGANQLKIWGASSNPEDKPVPIFDSILQVAANKTYDFILFKPTAGATSIALLNTQSEEPAPAAGYMKVKVANYATHCFTGPVDLVIRMTDNNVGDLVDVDTIRQVKSSFGDYTLCKTFDNTTTDGYALFKILDPVTQESLYNDLLFGVDFMNNAGKLYTIATLYIIEKENSNGIITGTDGKQYELEVKALFLD